MLKIFFVSAEVYPFTKSAGLGDVSGALPKYLKTLGHDVRVMMPNYRLVNERKYVLRDVIRLQGLRIDLGERVFEAKAKSAFIPDSKVQVYFLDNKHFFDRNGLYHDPKTGKAFADNAERYFFFAKGCLETLKLLYWQPDIIHCNDWHTAMIPVLLKTVYKDDDFFENTKTLFSVHNFSDVGCFTRSVLEDLGFSDGVLETANANGEVSFLQLGIQYADLLSTVSESYLDAVRRRFAGNDAIGSWLESRVADFVTVRNGIDDVLWNPETDKLLPFNFTRRNLAGKYKNKEQLQTQFELTVREDVPIVCCTGAVQGASEGAVLLDSVERLLGLDLQVMILGPVSEPYQKKLLSLKQKAPQKLGLQLSSDPNATHLIVAGSDFYLMPWYSEASELYQLYGQAYGTIPIVYNPDATEGTVQPFDAETQQGTGFVFAEAQPESLLQAVKQALQVYGTRELRHRLIQNTMKQNFSWKSSVRNYIKLYQKLATVKNSRKKPVGV